MKQKTWKFYPLDEFHLFKKSWDALNSSGPDTPLFDSAFLSLALREFGGGQELLAVCEESGEIIAACVLQKVRFGSWQTFQPSQCPMGFWLQRSDAEWKGVLDSLARSLPGIVLVIGVTQQDPAIVAIPQPGACIEISNYIETSRVTVAGSFEEYWANRGKNLRQNMSKQANRLKRNGISVELREITDPEAVAKAVDEYGLLESQGWKAESNTAVHPDNAQGRFYRNLIKDYSRRGEGVVYQLWYDADLAATDLCIKREGVLIILKTTYDEKLQATSPAILMRRQTFERFFDGGEHRGIEFYGKVMDWHRKWTDEIRTLYHLTYFRFAWIARLRRSLLS